MNINQDSVEDKNTGFIDLCVKKILLHLDETNNNTKLEEFNNFFIQDLQNLKIVYNTVPYNDSVKFITDWYSRGPATSHSLESFDYHVIPGLGNVVVSISCKCKFDESGNDKMGNNVNSNTNVNNNKRPLYGSAFGVSIQLVLDGNKLIQQKSLNNVIMALNYCIVYKPTDSLVVV
ncbi:hypothetical protein QEN19_002629 [Hanseniaspora menglaensis]